VHDVRTEVLRLRRALAQLLDAERSAGGLAAIAAALEETERVRHRRPPALLAARVDEVQQASLALKAEFGDELRWLINDLLDAEDAWPQAGHPEAAVSAGRAANAHLSSALVHAARLTLPDRLRRHLAQLRPGEQLSFEREFADELPEPEQRRETLDWLDRHSLAIGGIVDVARGVIWRTSPRASIRLLTCLAPVITIAVVAIALWGLTMPGGAWLFADDGDDLPVAFLVAMLGVVAHFLVSVIKRRQAAEPGGVYATGRWVLWLHVNWASVSLQVLSPLVVVVAMVVIGARLESSQDYVTFILAGYSADSLAFVFVGRLETAAATAAKTLQAQLPA
jgi:hypothetical protein